MAELARVVLGTDHVYATTTTPCSRQVSPSISRYPEVLPLTVMARRLTTSVPHGNLLRRMTYASGRNSFIITG